MSKKETDQDRLHALYGSPEENQRYHEKIMDLVNRHQLGFLHNPGGGQFVNHDKLIDIQVPNMGEKKDYERLLSGLQKRGLEP